MTERVGGRTSYFAEEGDREVAPTGAAGDGICSGAEPLANR